MYKFLILSDESRRMYSIIEQLSRLGGLNVTRSMPLLCDVMKSGITKAYALQRLAESLEIKREEIAAIGDQHNDIDLIEYAGLGIAVANAETWGTSTSCNACPRPAFIALLACRLRSNDELRVLIRRSNDSSIRPAMLYLTLLQLPIKSTIAFNFFRSMLNR